MPYHKPSSFYRKPRLMAGNLNLDGVIHKTERKTDDSFFDVWYDKS